MGKLTGKLDSYSFFSFLSSAHIHTYCNFKITLFINSSQNKSNLYKLYIIFTHKSVTFFSEDTLIILPTPRRCMKKRSKI